MYLYQDIFCYLTKSLLLLHHVPFVYMCVCVAWQRSIMCPWWVIPSFPLCCTGLRDPHHLQHGHMIQGIKRFLQGIRLGQNCLIDTTRCVSSTKYISNCLESIFYFTFTLWITYQITTRQFDFICHWTYLFNFSRIYDKNHIVDCDAGLSYICWQNLKIQFNILFRSIKPFAASWDAYHCMLLISTLLIKLI